MNFYDRCGALYFLFNGCPLLTITARGNLESNAVVINIDEATFVCYNHTKTSEVYDYGIHLAENK